VRTAAIVLVAYLLCVAVAAVWRLVPAISDAVPDLGALTAAYLGLTARRQLSPAIGGAVVLGYLVDLISGGPPGLTALLLGLITLIARAVQQRILVRGAMISVAFSAFVALDACVLSRLVREAYRVPGAAFAVELRHLAMVTFATAIVGPLMWRLFRRIDAAFARTQRERDAALEGLAP